MTVAMTQGVLNALNRKTLQAWKRGRARRTRTEAPPQTRAQFVQAVAQLAAAFPDNVKVH